MRIGPSYGVFVLVGSGWLPEYEMQYDPADNRGTCYIPSEPHQPFSLYWWNEKSEDLQLRLYMDGVLLGAWTTAASPYVKLSGIRISRTEKKQFSFSSGWKPSEEYDEDELIGIDRAKWDERGSIKLEVYKVKAVYKEVTAEDNPHHQGPKEELPTVRLEVKEDTQQNKMAVRDFQWDEGSGRHPTATFIFKHRAREWLQMYNFMAKPFDLDLSGMSLSDTSAAIVKEMKRLNMADEDRKRP